jgi:UDP-N-acetylmuramoylalanine--D-glutamate ligase
LGVEGLDIVRFLHQEGAAKIIVSDRRDAGALRERLDVLRDIPLSLSNNDPDLATRIDVLFVSQGIPDSLPLVQAARETRVPITAMMRHFLRRCPVPAIGITGSAGKTTTTTLVGEMFRAAGRKVFVGGNIGNGLLSGLASIDVETDVVLEVSHTQLVRTDRSPHLAAVLNVTPNHLDQFSWGAYVDLKRNLVRYQSPADIVVLPTDNDVAHRFASDTSARVVQFGRAGFDGPGATIDRTRVVWQSETGSVDICGIEEIQIPGDHNLLNVLAAVAIGAASDLDAPSMANAIRAFPGVDHRLQTVAEIDGVLYIDDSIATAPERVVASLRSLNQPVVLLLGGREKTLPLDMLATEAKERCRAIVCFGEAGSVFAKGLQDAWAADSSAPSINIVDDLASAMTLATSLAERGDAVLLAPAGTSFDAYANFEARGDHFAALAANTEPAAPTAQKGA